MLSIFDGLRDIRFVTVLFRLFLAVACGACIGLERSYKNRPAGFRTHILICMAGTVASMTGLYLYLNAHLATDISRLGAQVVSGLGFIGAGTIVVTSKKSIRGLTTAAGLWASGIIGLALGAGFYEGAITASALVVLTEICFAGVGKRIRRTAEFRMAIHYHQRLALDRSLRLCKDAELSITDLRIMSAEEDGETVYTAVVKLRRQEDGDDGSLLEAIRKDPEIFGAEILEDREL